MPRKKNPKPEGNSRGKEETVEEYMERIEEGNAKILEESENPEEYENIQTETPDEKIKGEKTEVQQIVLEYDELVIGPPGTVEVVTRGEKEKREVVAVIVKGTGVDGLPVKVELKEWALHKFYEKSHRTLKMLYKDLKAEGPDKQTALLTEAFNARKSPLKILMSGKTAMSVVSMRHKQFDFAQVRHDLDATVKEALGEIDIVNLGDSTLYRLPVDSKYVSAWLRINPGNNLAKGPSAIRFSTSFRTEFDSKSGGKVPACLNWANVWNVPTQLFGVKEKRITTLYKTIGEEKVDLLTGRNIHTLNKATIDTEAFKGYIESLIKAVPSMNQVIEEAVNQPLSKNEMTAILEAYRQKVGLAKYLIAKIVEKVQEETVWGLSQAVSYVRTHEEYRGMDGKDREELPNTRILENIAGEIYSIAPMIADLQQKGPITHKTLGIKAPKVKASA